MKKLLLILFLSFSLTRIFGQALPLHVWVDNLTKEDDQQSIRMGETINAIREYPDPEQVKIIPQPEDKMKTAAPFDIARFNMLKAFIVAFDVNETAAQFAASNKVDVKFKKIPGEVLEKKAVEQGDIKFYELASLTIKTTLRQAQGDKKKVTITLDNFIILPDDIPEEVRGSITHWSQWVDYWAVDWNYKDDTFHNEWQSYRTKRNPKIELSVSNTYEVAPQDGRKFNVPVKVIDILGNDTTKAIQIEI